MFKDGLSVDEHSVLEFEGCDFFSCLPISRIVNNMY